MIIYTKEDATIVIPCGLGPVVCQDVSHDLQMKQVDPSTSVLHIEPDQGFYGLYRVIVNPVTADIDPDLLASNIRRGVNILGVTGTFDGAVINNQDKTVNSSTATQQITSDAGYTGLGTVTVNAYTLDSKTVNPSVNDITVTPDHDGLSSVTVQGVTSSIDPDIRPENIKKDVEILGVTGNYEGAQILNQGKIVNSSTSSQTVTFDNGYTGLSSVTVNPYTLDSKTVNSSTSSQTINSSADGLSSVTVNPYTVESKSQTITVNGQYSFAPTSADALSGVDIDVQVADIQAVVQTKSVSYSSNGDYTVTPDHGYDGLSSVAINVSVGAQANLQSKTVNSSTQNQTVTPDQGYDGLSRVDVNAISDPNLLSNNIKKDVTILGITGTFNGNPQLQQKTVNSSTNSQIVHNDGGYDGLSEVIVNPYVLDSKTVNSSTASQTVISSENGLSSVTVNPYTLESKSDTLTANGQYVYTADNADALSQVTVNVSTNTVNNQSKTVNSSTSSQTVSPDQGYTGLSSVTVNSYVLDSKTVNPSTNSQTVTSSADGLSSVTVNAVTAAIDPDLVPGNIKNGVTILGVTGTYNPVSGDYIYETKTGVRTSLTTDFAGLTDQMYGANSLFNYCNTLESLTATMATWGNTPGQKIYVMSRLCKGCENLESVSFPNWIGSGNASAQFEGAFADCPKLTSVNFPEMTLAVGFDGAFSGSGDYSADASANFGKLERIGDSDMANCFSNSGFTSINMPLLETVLRAGLKSAFAGPDTSVSSMTFPSLTTCPNQDWTSLDPSTSSAFENAFINNQNITSVSFPELTTVGNQCFVNTFYNATGLTTLNMPKLSTFDKGNFSTALPFRYTYQDNTADFLYGCTSLVNLTIHPNCLVYGILAGAPNITNLTITDDITDNVRLDWQSSLTAASVMSVLTSLDPSTSGKTVTFYTGGLTVTDDTQGSIQTAYNTAVNNGWTVSNLTITPYS